MVSVEDSVLTALRFLADEDLLAADSFSEGLIPTISSSKPWKFCSRSSFGSLNRASRGFS